MTKTWQSVSLFALVSSVAGTVAAQPPAQQPEVGPAPPDQPTTVQPAPAPPPPPEQSMPAQAAPAAPYEAGPSPPVSYPPPPDRLSQRPTSNVGRFMVGLTWDVGIPVGSVHNYTANVSALGYEFQFRYWFHPRFSAGLIADWQTFTDNRPPTTYQVQNGAVNAAVYNRVGVGTLRAAGHYYFLEQGPILPYVGVNIGFGWATFQTAAADLVADDNKGSIVLGGEVGASFAFDRDAPRFLLGVGYSAQPSADFLTANDVQSITFQIGLASPAI